MEACLGSNPSYIWRSLMWSRDLIDSGLCWCIGDGSTVDIFRDRWIPSRQLKLGAESMRLPLGSKVSSPIQKRKWNDTLVRQVCLPYIANEILSIPIPTNNASNTRFWGYDPKGHYSVRNGYNVVMGVFDTPAHQSHNSVEQSWCRTLWSLHIPQKIRVFWWRTFHNLLPTAVNLGRHHVPVAHVYCPFCRKSEDTTAHAVLWCSAVKSGWKINAIWGSLKKHQPQDMQEICFWLLENASRKDMEEFIYQAWMIWSERCRLLHSYEDGNWRFHEINVADYIENYRKSMKAGTVASTHSTSDSPVHWTAPSNGQLRLDFDASFPMASDCSGVSGVIRNHDGQPLAAFGRVLPNPGSVILDELLAIEEGLKYVKERGFHRMIVSSDSQLTVQAVTKPVADLSYVGTCATCIQALQVELGVKSLFHVKRSENEVAHFLAQFASSSPAPFSWELGNFPSWLIRLVLNDMNFS